MAQGDFTKKEACVLKETLDEIMKAFPKNKAMDFIGHFNDIFLFLEACKKKCPDE